MVDIVQMIGKFLALIGKHELTIKPNILYNSDNFGHTFACGIWKWFCGSTSWHLHAQICLRELKLNVRIFYGWSGPNVRNIGKPSSGNMFTANPTFDRAGSQLNPAWSRPPPWKLASPSLTITITINISSLSWSSWNPPAIRAGAVVQTYL